MSCFSGQMKLYKKISIDRFDGLNLEASAFFLSHCHTDHMVGLSSIHLEHKLKKNLTSKLYVSEVTKVLLLEDSRYAFLEPYIQVLPIEEPKLIMVENINGVNSVTVTLLPAGHCPGSVMFLFEGNEGTCLYTGDFRLPKGSAARMKCLHAGSKVLKKIDHVHVDTTFCIPDATYIPGREQCLESLLSLVEGWICKGPDHIVRLNISAKYGYEYLYEALYNQFKKKIYCSRADVYHSLPDIMKLLTKDPTHAQIYACFKTEKAKEKNWSQWKIDNNDETLLSGNPKLKYLNVTLSTLYFTFKAAPEDVKIRVGKDHYRLCYSFHSSLGEVCDFLRYLKPRAIHANVIPRSGESFQTVENRLNELCFGDDSSKPQHEITPYKPFGKLSQDQSDRTIKEKANQRRNKLSPDDDSDEEFVYVARKKKK